MAVDLLLDTFTGPAGSLTGTAPDVGVGVWQDISPSYPFPLRRSGAGKALPTAGTGPDVGFFFGNNIIDVPVPGDLLVARFAFKAKFPTTGGRVLCTVEYLSGAGVVGSPGVIEMQAYNGGDLVGVVAAGNRTSGGSWSNNTTSGSSSAYAQAEHEYAIVVTAAGGVSITLDGATVLSSGFTFMPNDGAAFALYGFRITYNLQSAADAESDQLRVFYEDGEGPPGPDPGTASDFWTGFVGCHEVP